MIKQKNLSRTVLGLIFPLLLVGCEGAGLEFKQAVRNTWDNTVSSLVGKKATSKQIENLRIFDYPAEAPFGADLDIVVTHQGNAIALTNRTPRQYIRFHLWLNQQYVSEPPIIKIGSENRFELSGFVNHHGESFPLGGFLAPDKGFPVIHAELYDPKKKQRHRLVVIYEKWHRFEGGSGDPTEP